MDSSSEECDGNFSSDLECFEAHFLEENPDDPDPGVEVVGPQPGVQHDLRPMDYPEEPDDPDDPDDHGDPDNEDDNASSSSDEDANVPVANLMHDNLNIELELRNNLTKGELIALELANAVRHGKTFLSILDHFQNLNLSYGPKVFPECKSVLWNSIHLNKIGIQFHVYCARKTCGQYLGRKERLEPVVQCECGHMNNTQKGRFFVTLNIRNQIEHFLHVPGVWQQLQYARTRQKRSPTSIEDIYDGAEYRRLQQEGEVLAEPNTFTLVLGTDGCNPFKRGSQKIWPVYARVNELPPGLRQKFSFLVAVYIDYVDPNFQSYLKPVVKQLNSLSTRGVTSRPDGVNEVTSKFIPLCFCVDSPARCGILNMSQWNSDFGCTYCTHQGIQEGGNQRYPMVELQGIPPFEDRTHHGMQADMLEAQRLLNAQDNRRIEIPRVRGHKGTTPLLLLRHHDLREGQGVDDLHQDHEGCAAYLTELLLTEGIRVVRNMAQVELLRQIDARLLSIKTPSRVSRKPRSIEKRGKYNGSEWRNWLFFYAVPCLTGLLEPEYVELIALLSHGCYLLSQDVMEPPDLIEADRVLRRFAAAFEEKFHRHRVKFNIHVTTSHKVHCVRMLGSPFAYSTYNSESLNRKLLNRVTSPKGAIMQIVTRSLLHLSVHTAQYDERLSEEVRERLNIILNKERLKKVLQVAPNQYVVGRGEAVMPSPQESAVLIREGFHNVRNFRVYKSCLIGNTRYKSVPGQNPNTKSDDTFMYTHLDTFCTILKVILFRHNGEERCGVFVREHDVAQVEPTARHISILQNADADLLHYVSLDQVRCPAVKMNIEGLVYAASIPNCFEID